MRESRRALATAWFAIALGTSCFQYVPVTADPVAGARIAVEVSDAGRVALAQALGPGVIRVEGTLVSANGTGLEVDALQVTQLQLRPTAVDNVRVRVSREHIVRTELRTLSRRRTVALAGGAALAVATFFVTKGWFGRSTPPDEPGGPPGPDQGVLTGR